MVKWIARALNRPLFSMNMGATAETRAATVGTTHLIDGRTEFIEAEFLIAIEDPGGVVVLMDELPRASKDSGNLILSLLDDQRFIRIDEAQTHRVVTRHEEAIIFFTANEGFEYPGISRAIDWALKDRLSILILDYPSAQGEARILVRTANISLQEADYLDLFATKARTMWKNQEIMTPVSTRMILEAGSLVGDGLSSLDPCNSLFSRFLAPKNGPTRTR